MTEHVWNTAKRALSRINLLKSMRHLFDTDTAMNIQCNDTTTTINQLSKTVTIILCAYTSYVGNIFFLCLIDIDFIDEAFTALSIPLV